MLVEGRRQDVVHGGYSLSKLDIQTVVFDAGCLYDTLTFVDVFGDAFVNVEIVILVEGDLIAI